MANWFRLCENRHTDRNRQLRIAQGPLPPPSPPSFPLLSLPPVQLSPPLLLCLHTHPFSEWKRPVSSLLSVLSSSPGPSFPPSVRPGVLLVVVSVWTVAVGGWRIALSERARAGPTCSACSDMDSEFAITVHHHGLISQETAFATAYLSCMYMVVSFCQTKGHSCTVQVPKDFNVDVLKPLNEWPF